MASSVATRSQFIDYVEALLVRLSPLMAVAYYRAIRDIASAIDPETLADAIARHGAAIAITKIVNDQMLSAAFVPLRTAIRDVVARAGVRFYRDTPIGPPDAVPIARVRFNVLDPTVVSTIERFEADALGEMATTIRTTITQAVSEGLRAGVNPRQIAVGIRDVIGLSPQQETFIRNYRAELQTLAQGERRALLRAVLRAGNTPAALARKLTDGRTDRTVRAAIMNDRSLTATEIETASARYRKNLKANQAESTSRTLTLNAMREAQILSWQQAIDAGKVDADDLEETWITTLDGRERPAHHAMHGAKKGFNDVWFVPGVGRQRYPGESEYNCRCRTWIAPRVRDAPGTSRPAA